MQSRNELLEFQEAAIGRELLSNVEFTLSYTVPLAKRLFGEDIRGLRVLSVGCGVGKDVETLVDAGVDAFGVDPGCRITAWKENKHRVRLMPAYGQALPFRPNHFDMTMSLGVLEHVGTYPYPRAKETVPDYLAQRLRFVHETTRVTRPGGHIILSTPNRHCPIDFWHHSKSRLLRPHWPWETFTVSFGQLKRWFIDYAGCRSIEVLPLEGAFAFKQVRRHFWGRVLVSPGRSLLRLMFVGPFRLLSRSFLNPFLIVDVRK